MAINPETRWVGKINASDANYPYGSARDVTVPGDGTGTPWEDAYVNDIWGLLQKLLSVAGITPSGNPDTILLSDYFDALEKINGRFVTHIDTGAADAYVLDSASGADIEALYDGFEVLFLATNTNAGACTINPAGVGVTSFTLIGGTAIPGGKIISGTYYRAVYRTTGTRFELVETNPLINEIAGKIGIGTAAPDQTFHAFKGSAGAVASVSDTVATLENSANAYQQFLTPNTAEAGLVVGDVDNNDAGGLIYNHPFDYWTFIVNALERMRLNSTGLGIGTGGAADERLHVEDSGANSDPTLKCENDAQAFGFITKGTDSDKLHIADITNAIGAIVITPATGFVQVYDDCDVAGTFTAGTKTFVIDNPLDKENKLLVFSTTETPGNEIVFKGKVNISNGTGVASIDGENGLTEGIFEAMSQDVSCRVWTNDKSAYYSSLRGEVVGGDILVESDNLTDEFIAEFRIYAVRADDFVKTSSQTDENGLLINEPSKEDPSGKELEAVTVEVKNADQVGEIDEKVILRNTKGFYRHPEAHGVEVPTRKVKKVLKPKPIRVEVNKTDAFGMKDVPVKDEENLVDVYVLDSDGNVVKTKKPGVKTEPRRVLKEGVQLDSQTGKFFKYEDA